MKKLITLCLIFFALASCQKDNSVKITLKSDYFPLKVGNYWNFELAGKYLVKESTLVNETDYFEIINDDGISEFYSILNNKIYVRDPYTNKEEMKFDLIAETNKSWTYGKGSVKLANRNASLKIGDVQVDNCLEFIFYNNNLTDYGYTIWLAPEIGFIQQSCTECFGTSSVVIKLLDANINNQEIKFKQEL